MLTPDFLLKRLPASARRGEPLLLSRSGDSFIPYALALAALLGVACFGAHFWRTNDDPHMAMIAHGYALADAGSPGLVYSNVVWGWLVMQLGSPFGVQGYTLGAYGLLALSCAALAYALRRAGALATLGAAALLGMFADTTLEMQFSITAGYLAVAGFALALTAPDARRIWPWAASALLLTLSALVRLDECLFICVLAAPFCAARLLRTRERRTRLAWAAMLGGTALAIGACLLVNRAYYSAPEWRQFVEMNQLRRPFTDYAYSNYYLQRRAELQGSSLTRNDMKLMDDWFFADPTVFNQASLAPLVEKVSLAERLRFNFGRFWSTRYPFQNPQIMELLCLFALAVAVVQRRKAALAGFLLLLGVMAVFWLLGRPGVIRIYPAAAAGLLVFTLAGGCRRSLLTELAGIVALSICLCMAWSVFHDHLRSLANSRTGAAEVCALQHDQLQVVWGTPDGLQDRYIYRPFSPPGGECPLQIYMMGVLQLLPANLEQLHRATGGKDLVPALLDGQSLYFLTDERRLGLLATFLHEHYGATLKYTELHAGKSANQYLVQAVK